MINDYNEKTDDQNISCSPDLSFYNRLEKVHIPLAMLPKLQLVEGVKPLIVSDDYIMRNCVQCHAPNV